MSQEQVPLVLGVEGGGKKGFLRQSHLRRGSKAIGALQMDRERSEWGSDGLGRECRVRRAGSMELLCRRRELEESVWLRQGCGREWARDSSQHLLHSYYTPDTLLV